MDEYEEEYRDVEEAGKLDAVKQWVSERPVAAAVAAGLALSLVVSAIALPFMLGGDEPAGPERGITVEQNPTGSKPNHTPVPQKDREATGSNESKLKVDAPVIPPKAPGEDPTPARIDGVTDEEVQEVQAMNIPAPPAADPAPQAAQHQLPRPVPGEGATEAVGGVERPAPEVHDAMEIRGHRVPVIPMGLNEDDAFIPPENVGQVGWYQDSAEAGTNEKGSIVMSSHINSRQQGNGIGSVFATLEEGEEISIWNTKGELTKWRVTKSYAAPKEGGLPDVVQKMDGEQVLVLVTCIGEYVGPPLYYADNHFIEAVQVK